MEYLNENLALNVQAIVNVAFWLLISLLMVKGFIDMTLGNDVEIINRERDFDFEND